MFHGAKTQHLGIDIKWTPLKHIPGQGIVGIVLKDKYGTIQFECFSAGRHRGNALTYRNVVQHIRNQYQIKIVFFDRAPVTVECGARA